MKQYLFWVFFISSISISNGQSPSQFRLDARFIKGNYPDQLDHPNVSQGISLIRLTVSDAILNFRVKCNPEIDQRTVYDSVLQKFKTPEEVFKIPFPVIMFDISPLWTTLDGEKTKMDNFFVLTKKGTKNLPSMFSKDTISLVHFDKYYPFDEIFLIYYDIKKGWGYAEDLKILSGACDVSYFDIKPYNRVLLHFTDPYFAAFFRLFRFGLKEPSQIDPFYPPDDSFTLDYRKDTMDWFRIDSFALSKGYPAIVKVPNHDKFSAKYNYFDGIEVIFYEYPVYGEERSLGFWEVKYTFHNQPKSYEDTLPKYRKLSDEEIKKLGRWYVETFVEPVIRLSVIPDDEK